MKRWLLVFFLIPFGVAFDITEIMHNPSDGNEWIEFYTGSEINFSGYELIDNLHTDQLICCGGSCNYIVPQNSYFLILDQDSTLNYSGIRFCVDDVTIGNTLGNTNDKIAITKNLVTYVNISYQKTVASGNSIILINNSWQETTPTPGYNYTLIAANTSEDVQNEINETCENCSEITVNQTLENCSINISIQTDKVLYEKGESVKINHIIVGGKYPKVYWVEDLFGKIVNEKKESNTTSQKTYTPSFEGSEKSFLLFAELNTSCNNLGNNLASKLITVRGNETKNSETKIEITNIPDEISFGDLFEVEFRIDKGSSRKTAVKVFVEKDSVESEVTSLNILSKNEEIELSIPIKMKDKCGVSGKYDVVIEGLDTEAREEIEVSALACQSSSIKKSSSSSGGSSSGPSSASLKLSVEKEEYELLEFTKEIEKESKAKIKIYNADTKAHNYTIHSYIYSGPVSLSGEREKNIIKFSLKPKEEKEISLENILEDSSKTDMKLKVKIERDDRKTPHEFTEDLILKSTGTEEEKESYVPEIAAENISENISGSNLITGNVIYEKEKPVTYLPYMVIPLLLALGYIVYKKLI